MSCTQHRHAHQCAHLLALLHRGIAWEIQEEDKPLHRPHTRCRTTPHLCGQAQKAHGAQGYDDHGFAIWHAQRSEYTCEALSCAPQLCCVLRRSRRVTDRPAVITASAGLTHLLLREQDVLPHSRIVFDKLKLVGQRAGVLLLHIEVACARSTD